jgi:DNA end-binding protein Ku
LPEPSRRRHHSDARRSRPRALWSGTLTFGLVSIPVELFPAHRSERVSLRMLDPEGRPLRRRYFCPRDGRALEDDEIVRGYQRDGELVIVTDEELESLAPERSRDIALEAFVDRREIDPFLVNRAYFLVPSGGSTKPYQLLASTIEETGRAGIGTFVMRGRAYRTAIFADAGILRAQTLRVHDEVRPAETLGDIALPEPPDELVAMLVEDIESLEADALDPAELEDERAHRLAELVTRKHDEHRDLVAPEGDETRRHAETMVIDLMQVLAERLRGSSQPDPEPESLESSSKSELYERARALDIEGRSRMSKDELIEAIRKSA